MTSLIERIEAAVPCRGLDAEIFRAIGSPLPTQFGPMGIDLEWDAEGVSAFVAVGDMRIRFMPPAYTSSLDAALTLVPEGWGAIIYMDRGNESEVALESEPLEKYATALRPDNQVPLALSAQPAAQRVQP